MPRRHRRHIRRPSHSVVRTSSAAAYRWLWRRRRPPRRAEGAAGRMFGSTRSTASPFTYEVGLAWDGTSPPCDSRGAAPRWPAPGAPGCLHAVMAARGHESRRADLGITAAMSVRPPARPRAALGFLSGAVTGFVCAGLMPAVVVVRTPPAALGAVVLVCIALLLGAGSALARSADFGRTRRLERRALAELRRQLDALPETRHPLGD